MDVKGSLIGWVIVGGAVGAAIGSNKGQGGLGFVLGALLGVLGWVIVAVMAPAEQPAAGWWPDPRSVHQLRYNDGKRWTAYVSDDGVISIER